MFVYTTIEDSYAEHQRLLGWEKEFLDKLELAYRVIDVAAGDLGLSRPAQVRLRGLDPDAGQLPRADLDLQLHRLPDPPPRHPRPRRRRRRRSRSRPSTARSAAITRTDRGDPRDPPAGRRVGAGPRGAAALPRRPRGAEARRDRDRPLSDGWRPRLVALDIDGTLLKWVEGAGTTYEQITARGLRRRPPGATTPARTSCSRSGRSPHGMTRIADLLGLPPRGRRPALGGGVQRCGDLPLPAARGRARGDLRRPAGGRGGARASTRTRWSRSRSAASATASTGHFPDGRAVRRA